MTTLDKLKMAKRCLTAKGGNTYMGRRKLREPGVPDKKGQISI